MPDTAVGDSDLRELNGAHLPATDQLLRELAEVVRDLREHERSGQARPGDIYSGNLHGWMGERMAQVLARLINSEARLTELEATLERYVGKEPTVAEEMAYLNRCLNAVHAVCALAEKQATRWEHPLPLPEWVATVRKAAGGGHEPEDKDAELAEARAKLEIAERRVEELATENEAYERALGLNEAA